MARKLRTFAWMMTSLVALAGTATAGASVLGGVDASVTSDHGSASASGDAAANYQDGQVPTVDGNLDAAAQAQDHAATASADTDGNAAATVDDTTVSTDDIGATDVPGAPDASGSLEFNAVLDAMVDAGEGLMIALSAAVTALLEW